MPKYNVAALIDFREIGTIFRATAVPYPGHGAVAIYDDRGDGATLQKRRLNDPAYAGLSSV